MLQIILQVDTAISLAEKSITSNNIAYIFLAIIIVAAIVIVYVFRMYKEAKESEKQLLADRIAELQQNLKAEKEKSQQSLDKYVAYVVESEKINKENYTKLEFLIKNFLDKI